MDTLGEKKAEQVYDPKQQKAPVAITMLVMGVARPH